MQVCGRDEQGSGKGLSLVSMPLLPARNVFVDIFLRPIASQYFECISEPTSQAFLWQALEYWKTAA